METDSLPGDVDSLRGGLSLLDPLVDRILGDAVSQQQGWLRVYGKKNTPGGRTETRRPGGSRDRGQQVERAPATFWIARYPPRAQAEVMEATGGTGSCSSVRFRLSLLEKGFWFPYTRNNPLKLSCSLKVQGLKLRPPETDLQEAEKVSLSLVCQNKATTLFLICTPKQPTSVI